MGARGVTVRQCIICEGEIPAARLEISPHTKTCKTACARENTKNRVRINKQAYDQRRRKRRAN